MKFKILQKILISVIFASAIFSLFPTSVISQTALDSGDSFYLALPLNGQAVFGYERIVWKMIDDEQQKPAYEISLLDVSCTTKLGTLFLSTDREIVPTNGFYVYDWNRNDSMKEAVTPEDGSYCVEVKAQLLSGTTSYALSARSVVTLTGKGLNEPVITSEPGVLSIATGQTFSYEAKANDEDGDTLSYSLLEAPSWLSINKDSGLVNGQPDEAGTYLVILEVSDGKGGKDRQVFALNVSSNALSTLSFDLQAGAIFSGSTNNVAWQSSDADGIERQSLEYSNDGFSWVLIGEVEESKKSLNWDVSGFGSGEYYLRLKIADAANNSTESQVISKRILVVNQVADASEASIIYNLSPLPNSVVEAENLTISGSFLSPRSKKIDVASVQVFLDGIEISKDCSVNEEGFTCSVERSLESGLHKVKVTYRDSMGSGEKEWTFSVSGTTTGASGSNGDSDSGFPVSGIALAAGVACIIILLLAIPWVLYLMWRKKKNDEVDDEPVNVSPAMSPASGSSTDFSEYSQAAPSESPSEVVSPSVAPGDAGASGDKAKASEDPYAIGSQAIPAEEAGGKEFEITEMEATEQPKWLTEEQPMDVEKASKPVTPEGNVAVPNDTDEDSAITQPHGYGAPVPDEDNGQS